MEDGSLHRSDPLATEWLARTLKGMPQAGGQFLGFPLLSELGSGAFGRVFLSRQGELADRLVVLKVVPQIYGESRTLARLQHPNIVPIYSVHQANDYQAVCMPFLGKTTLADILIDLRRRRPLPESGRYLIEQITARAQKGAAGFEGTPNQDSLIDLAGPGAHLAQLTYVEAILWIAERLAEALAHAHGQGIVHRDLKPANVLLTNDGRPMLLDFNLSLDHKLHQSAAATRIGGTLPYMAPEQLVAVLNREGHGDERSDLYSLGIIVFELLTGRYAVARRHESVESLVKRAIEARPWPQPMRRWNGSVTSGVESIVHHCLDPYPARRYQTALELAEDLRRQSEHRNLIYATERSTFERGKKWARRYPRLTSSISIGVVAALVIVALTATYIKHTSNLGRFTAAHTAAQSRLRANAARASAS